MKSITLNSSTEITSTFLSMKTLLFAILTGLFYLIINTSCSQFSEKVIDDENNEANKSKVDSINQKAFSKLSNNPDKAYSMASNGYDLAMKQNYKKGLGQSLKIIAEYYFRKGEIDSALVAYGNSIAHYKLLPDKKLLINSYIRKAQLFNTVGKPDSAWVYYSLSKDLLKADSCPSLKAKVYYSIGDMHFRTGDYLNAMKYQLDAYRFAELAEDTTALSIISGNIGNIYFRQENYENSYKYHRESLEKKIELDDKRGIAVSYNNLGAIKYIKDEFDTAINYYRKAGQINEEINEKNRLAANFNNIGLVYNYMENYDKALEYYLKSYYIAENAGIIEFIPALLNNIGLVHQSLLQNEKALDYFRNASEYADKTGDISVKRDVFQNFYLTYNQMEDYKNALKYHKKYFEVSDSLLNENVKSQISELKIAFDVEKKENQIELLNIERDLHLLKIRQSRYLLITLISGTLLLSALVITLIVYRNRKRTQRELLKRVIETEEIERKRFAEDLHDSLGPSLSAVKMCVGAMGNVEDEERDRISGNALEMLDSGIKNMRNIANNLMPVEIEKQGFMNALKSFANRVSDSKRIKVNLENKNGDEILDKTVEIVLYRVVCELINNTVKHSGAENVFIKVFKNAKNLTIKYSDDGEGFDFQKYKISEQKKGIGLNSLNYRIKTINGKLVINSKKGEGMQALIEVVTT